MTDDFDPKIHGGSVKRNIVNPDLLEERKNCNFDQAELEDFLMGAEMPEMKRALEFIDSHPEVYPGFEYFDLTREEKMEHWWKIVNTVMKDEKYHDLITSHSKKGEDKTKTSFFRWYYMYPGVPNVHMHFTMFMESIKMLGSEEQQKEWLPKGDHMNIIGCYAQTELGHGSNVAGLETTATLDLATDEFVINTPTFKATKFWPGSLGVVSTHAVVFARCISGENDFGPQAFMVPIRSLEDHKNLPGIKIGDLGDKLGYTSMDNGWMSFDHVRIPRTNQLSRFGGLSKEGDLDINADPRMLYQVMVTTRMLISSGCSANLMLGCLIASRYAVCRRQFSTMNDSKEERKLLDYQTHMKCLGTNLAQGFVIKLTIDAVDDLLRTAYNEVEEKGSYKLLDVLHHVTSGVKAVATEAAYNGIDEMRQACGGAGFLQSSGILAIWQETTPFPTYEGVNVVMLQQSSRYLFKQYAKVVKGKKVAGYFTYLNDINAICSAKSQAKTVDEFLTWDHITLAMTARSAYCVRRTAELLKNDKSSQKSQQNELFALEVNQMARFHLNYVMFEMARSRVVSHTWKDKNILPHMETLIKLFAVKHLMDDSQFLFEMGFFTQGSSLLRDQAFKQLLTTLRPNMIPIVEFSPMMGRAIHTTIGNWHGDIYEQQLDVAKASRLNKTEVPPYYNSLMKPTMTMRKPNL